MPWHGSRVLRQSDGLIVIAVQLQIRAGQLNLDIRGVIFRRALYLHDLGERQSAEDEQHRLEPVR